MTCSRCQGSGYAVREPKPGIACGACEAGARIALTWGIPRESPPTAARGSNSSAIQAPKLTPAQIGTLLKAALYMAVGMGFWWLLRSGATHEASGPEGEEPGAGDYATWEPAE
jgi:hypothetical protein